jgi:hypothetical protein
MTSYTVAVSETLVHEVIVEAASPEAAEEQARQAVLNRTTEIVDSQYEDRQTEILDPRCDKCGWTHATADCWRYGQANDGELVLETPPHPVFTDFDDNLQPFLDSLPGWQDASWRNDACPHLTHPDYANDLHEVCVWIDYKDPARRENGGDWPRFNVSLSGTGEQLVASNDWDEILQAVRSPRFPQWWKEVKEGGEAEPATYDYDTL